MGQNSYFEIWLLKPDGDGSVERVQGGGGGVGHLGHALPRQLPRPALLRQLRQVGVLLHQGVGQHLESRDTPRIPANYSILYLFFVFQVIQFNSIQLIQFFKWVPYLLTVMLLRSSLQ